MMGLRELSSHVASFGPILTSRMVNDTQLSLASRWRQRALHLGFVFLSPAAKKAKKVQRPLKKQMSSPNFQRRDKAEKVSQQLYDRIFKLRNFIVRMSETRQLNRREALMTACPLTPQAQSRDNTPFM